jgi:hypothetical protein
MMGFNPPPFANTGGLDFSSLLNTHSSGTQGATLPTVAAVEDPAVRFASQLQQLQDMGFADSAANLEALKKTNGNVNNAVERLLGGN